MSALIEEPGLQTAIQDRGRSGWRHMGVPSAGAADLLSLALANRLVGNGPEAPGLEMALTGAVLRFNCPTAVAITGGTAQIHLNEESIAQHTTIAVETGDQLSVGPAAKGARVYLAVAGGVLGGVVFGSAATYLPAAFGGYNGRALRAGDEVQFGAAGTPSMARTPDHLVPFVSDGWILRVVDGPESEFLSPQSRSTMFTKAFTASNRASRMGLELEGQTLGLARHDIESSAVFPGTVQCPAGGNPFLLLADAQTTGGYPRIAQVIRADRHLMGQIRPGDTVRFMIVSPDRAEQILREKSALYNDWLGYCPFV